MAMIKKALYSVISIEALNEPYKWKEFNFNQVKFASIAKDDVINIGGFDLKSAISENPDHLFVKIFAIKKDEINDNGDAFSEEELKKGAHTFIGVPIFTNHQNDDVEKARGKCVHAWYDQNAGGIYIISMIDKVAYPQLARGIKQGYISGTSMGTSVEYSCCSICHNKAHTAEEYCSCVKERKNRKFSGKVKCTYHNSQSKPDDDCPICGKKKGESKEIEYKEAQVFEHNFGLKFIEDSFVVNPACHDCLVQEIFNIDELDKKVANLKKQTDKLLKAASCQTGKCDLEKHAGKQEIEDLKNAMNTIERVAKSMMSQKDHVSMEYVSDLVEVMANVQSVTDELVEMGYMQLASPVIGEESVEMPKTSTETSLEAPPQMETQPQTGQFETPTGNVVENLGGIGSITKPKFSAKLKEKKKDFIRLSSNLIDRLQSLRQFLNETVTIANSEVNDKEYSEMDNMKTGQNQVDAQKTAEHDLNVITEKQLPDAEFTGKRQGTAPNVITEKQLNDPRDVNVTTSKSPQERLGSYDVITEKQLSSIKEGYVTRWDTFPAVITEKQWEETNRMIGSELSRDQSNIITEKQLIDFLGHHRYVPANVITEKQLSDDSRTTTGDLSRWAYTYDASRLLKAASEAVSDAIAFYGKTPQELKRTSSVLTENVRNADKAAYLVLINALPHKAAARNDDKVRYNYLSKLADTNVPTPSTTDVLIASMSDKLEDLSADDLIQTVQYVVNNEKALNIASELAKIKLQSGPSIGQTVDKFAALDKAVNEMSKEADGLYQINIAAKDIGMEPVKNGKFLKAAHKCAESLIGLDIKTALMKLDVSEDKENITATLKDVDKLNGEEKKAWSGILDLIRKDDKAPLDLDDESPLGLGGDEECVECEEDGLPSLKELLREYGDDEVLDGEGGEEELDENGNPVDVVDNTKEEDMKYMDTAAPGMANMFSTMASRKGKREDLVKTAQDAMFGGGPAGQAGAAPGIGQPAGAVPQAGGAAGAPLESFEQSDMGEEFGDEGASDLQPSPPGTKCPVCSSDDVTVSDGKGVCGNCGSKVNYKVVLEVVEWAGLLEDSQDAKEEEEKDEFGGEGFEMPTEEAAPMPGAGLAGAGGAPTAPAMPAAASTKNNTMVKEAGVRVKKFATVAQITPIIANKMKKDNIKLGSVSPLTGSVNTIDLGDGKHLCLDTGHAYHLRFAFNKNKPKEVYAEWSWDPNVDAECPSCTRRKQDFVNALGKMNISEEEFDGMSLKTKSETIISMKSAGLLKNTKVASAEDDVVAQMVKKAEGRLGNRFPMETCLEKLARRYGEDALALSGPCEGKPLANCICETLKKAGVYSDNTLFKVADIWSEKEAGIECIEDHVRMGFDLKESAVACEGIKTKYAQNSDILAEKLAQLAMEEDVAEPGLGGGVIEEETEEIDPFADEEVSVDELGDSEVDEGRGGGENTVTINIPANVLEQLDRAIDEATGENVEDELHHQEPVPNMDVDVEVPADAAEAVDEAADTALDQTMDVEPNIEEEAAQEESFGGDEPVVEEEVGVEGDLPVDETVVEETEDCGMAPMDAGSVEVEIEDDGFGGNGEVDEVGEESRVQKLERRVEELTRKVEGKEKTENKEPGVRDGTGPRGGSEECPFNKNVENKEGENEDKSNNDEDKEVVPEEQGEFKEGEDMETSAMSEQEFEKEATAMRRGHISSVGKMGLDLSKVAEVLKKAGVIKLRNAQDSVPFTYTNNSVIGDEDKFKADDPSAPSKGDASKMGQEEPPSANKPDIPVADARMGGEKGESDLKPELDDSATGGIDGAGNSKAASTRDMMNGLADRIIEAQTQIQRKQDQDLEEVKPYGGNSWIGNEKESIGEIPKANIRPKQVPITNNAFIGDEKASIGDKPSDNDTPNIPTKDDRIGGEKDNDKIKPEHDNEMTGLVNSGTVLAESKTNIKEASRVAGKMLQAGRIQPEDLASKIAELQRYQPEQLKDFEDAIFSNNKGLNNVPDGIEQPVIIHEASNQRNAQNELAHKLQSLFSLNKQNVLAQQDTVNELRRLTRG